MNATDSKYFHTAEKMDEALISLLGEKPFDFITVKEICKRAGVNRSTFYLHYETLGDLLSETVELTNRRFLSYFETDTAQFIGRIETCPLKELTFVTPQYLLPYLHFVRDNRHILKAAFERPSTMESQDRFASLYRYVFDPILNRFSVPQERRPFMIRFYLHGIMAIIGEWVEHDCDLPEETISSIISNCVKTIEHAD